MPKSMTGFGRARRQLDGRDILVEIRSVNHRYFEFSARTPRAYGYLDEKLKALVSAAVSRGKVELSVYIVTAEGNEAGVTIDRGLADRYVEALRSLAQPLGLRDDLSLSAVARLPDIFQLHKTEADAEVVWGNVREVAEEALAGFTAMRAVEGERLMADVSGRLAQIERCVGEVELASPQTVAAYQRRLAQKLREVLEGKGIDEARILTEAAIFADRVAVDEETVRLKSHLGQFRTLLGEEEPVGRRLDFLTQELNREVNTIGSKCQDVSVTNLVLALKAELEKIREQIQNME